MSRPIRFRACAPRQYLGRKYRPLLEHLETRLAPANVDLLQYHNDLSLTGQNLFEEILTPANVNPTNFGLLFSQPVDGYIYAQPLYKASFPIAGGIHDVAFVATEHDSVYAIDADSPTAGPNGNGIYWQTSFLNPAAGITTVPSPSQISNSDIVPEIGITGTPVIDGSTNTLYVVAVSLEQRGSTAHYVQKLHALDLATGAERPAGPYTLGDTVFGGPDAGFTDTTSIVVNGRGDGADSSGRIFFNAARENNRSALQIVNGTVYAAFAAHSDYRPYHGWLLGFDESTLQLTKMFNTALNAGGVGIWQSGGAVSADDQGNLYFAVGNGFNGTNLAFDPAHGNYSESVLKLSASGQLTVADYFTPYDWRNLDQRDADLGSGGVMLLPDGVGSSAHAHLMVETGKSGKIYLIDRDNLGQNNPNPSGPDHVVQTVTAGQAGVWGNPSLFQIDPTDAIIYYHGSGDVLKAYYVHNGHIEDGSRMGDRPIMRSPNNTSSGFPGTQPVISANGLVDPNNPVNGIVWELQVDNFGGGTPSGNRPLTGPAYLRALDATNLSNVLYDSKPIGDRDLFGEPIKFTVPTVVNGQVLVGQARLFSVFGLFPPVSAIPAALTNLAGAVGPGSAGPVINLTWTDPIPNPGETPTGINVYRSTDGVNYSLVNTEFRTATSFTDPGPFEVGQRIYYRVVAVNQAGEALPSNTISLVVPIPSSILTLSGAGASSIGLSWTAVANDHSDIERSSDGVTFTRIATVPSFQTTYVDTGLSTGQYAYRIHAFNVNPDADSLSNVQGEWIGPAFDHGAGFANATDLTSNGDTFISPTEHYIRLTSADSQRGSTFSNGRIAIGQFTTSFDVRLHEGTQPNYADGFAFVIQTNASTALGQSGAGLGYQGITHSIAVKFSTFQHPGDPSDSTTGLVLNGANPSGGVDTTPSGVLISSQDTKRITLTYDGTTLSETILNLITGDMFTTSFTVNIPAVIGSDTAYVGFTGASGTNDYWELQDVQNWTFTTQSTTPGAPTNLRQTGFASSAIDLTWTSNSYNEAGFWIERSTDGTNFTPVGMATGRNFEDAGFIPGIYYYRVRAISSDGSVSPPGEVLQASVPGPLVTSHQDVGTAGDPTISGSTAFANGTYTLRASGSDIGGTSDHFQFAYQPFLGDGEIVARVVTESAANSNTKAGVMFRESLAPGSKNALMLETPGPTNTPMFQWRALTDNATASANGANGRSAPIWVRLVRQGTAFTGYYAVDRGDGTHGPWIQVGNTQGIVMSPNIYVGLALSAHTNSTTSTSTFDHVQIVTATPQTTHFDVSAAMSTVNPDTPLSITVQALDPFNNLVTNYLGTVHFTSSDSQVMLPDYTFTAADNGQHTFTVSFHNLGRQDFNVTDTTYSIIAGRTVVTVSDGALASAIAVGGFPTRITAGTQASFTVTALDDQGHTLPGYRGTVHFTSSDTRAMLPSDYMFTAADAGTHVFQATLESSGSQSIDVADVGTLLSGSQSGIHVAPAPPVIGGTTIHAAENAVFGSVPRFNGTDEYAQVPSSLVLGGAITIEAWVKSANVFASWARVADFANGASQDNIILGWMANTGHVYFETYVNGQSERLTAPDVFPQNQWVHVAGVNDGNGTGFIYINGTLVASGPQFAPATVLRAQQYLARSNYTADAFFNGSLEDVHIWNTTRSQDEIRIDMDQLTGTEPGLVAYYRLDEARGTTAFDSTTNHFDAALTSTRSGGHPSWVTDPAPGAGRDLATFTVNDASARVNDYVSLISWGDGSRSVGTITATTLGSFRITGTHPFGEEGMQTVHIVVLDQAGHLVYATTTATITDPSVAATGGFTINATTGTDTGLQTVATFTDPAGTETIGDYSADINWGDNMSSSGSISGPTSGVFMVNGNHTYSQSGSYSITVTLHHDSAADAVVTSAANVTDPGGSPFGGHLFFGLGGTIAPASHTTDSMSLPALDTWIIELLTVQQLPSDNPRSLPAVPMDQPALVPDASDRPAQGLDDDVMNLAQFA